MIGGLFLLIVVVSLAWAVGQLLHRGRAGEPTGAERRHTGDARELVAQLFRLGLQLAAVALVAEGLTGIVAELLPQGDELIDDPTRLARALAFTVVGGPALAALGTWTHRRLRRDPDEADSLGWAGYLTAAELVGLILAMTALYSTLVWVAGTASFDGRAMARAMAWLTVWALHARWNRQRPRHRGHTPTALLLGSAIGWVVTAVAAGQTVAKAFQLLYDRAFTDLLATDGANAVRRAVVALVIGAVVWFWYWLRAAQHEEPTVPWSAYVLLLGSLGSLVAAVVGTAVTGYEVLQWFFGDVDAPTAAAHFASLPGSSAAALVGVAGWAYHQGLVQRSAAGPRRDVHRVADYLPAAVGLVTLAVAVTSSVAALLGALASSGALAGDGAIAGQDVIRAVTLIAVGGPVWARYWRRAQRHAASQAELRSTPRRLYLLVLFGVAAVVALVSTLSLLVVLFEDIARGELGRGTVDDLSVPVGLVLSTVVVAAYHATVFRRDRRLTLPTEPTRRVREVLVIGGGAGTAAQAEALADQLRQELGLSVRLLDAVPAVEAPGADTEPTGVAGLLATLEQPVAVVLVRPDGSTEVLAARAR